MGLLKNLPQTFVESLVTPRHHNPRLRALSDFSEIWCYNALLVHPRAFLVIKAENDWWWSDGRPQVAMQR